MHPLIQPAMDVRDLHDVCFMHGSDQLAVVCSCMLECKLSDSKRCVASDQLDALNNTVYNLTVQYVVSLAIHPYIHLLSKL